MMENSKSVFFFFFFRQFGGLLLDDLSLSLVLHAISIVQSAIQVEIGFLSRIVVLIYSRIIKKSTSTDQTKKTTKDWGGKIQVRLLFSEAQVIINAKAAASTPCQVGCNNSSFIAVSTRPSNNFFYFLFIFLVGDIALCQSPLPLNSRAFSLVMMSDCNPLLC